MSHSLKLKVLAEGVEDLSQLTILQELKCEKYQGYHFSEAIPADLFQALLKKHNKD